MMKIFKHFKIICKHRWYVFKNCCKAGIFWQGLVHDLSKFSPTEFWESAKYYIGTKSPIDVCKEKNGYSKAWMHHKGRNKHHYEYWVDNFDNGGTPLQMPFKYALEMICDYLGAGQAYEKKKFTYQSELNWWHNKCSKPIAMHKQTQIFVELMFKQMAFFNNNDALKKKNAKELYNSATKIYLVNLGDSNE